MHCDNVQPQLDDYLDGALPAFEQSTVADHLAHCKACAQTLAQLQQMRLALKAMPVVPPRPGYMQRVLGFLHEPEAKPARQTHRPWWFATGFATAMLAVFGVWVLFVAPSRTTGPDLAAITLQISPQHVRKVDLVFHSPQQIRQATLRLELPAGIELSGYAKQHILTWQTTLKPGANRLTLPLLATGSVGGTLTARITHNGKSRTYRINIVTTGASSQRAVHDLTV